MPKLKVDLVVDDKGSLVVTGFGNKVDKVMYSSGASVKNFGKELAVAGAGITALLTTTGLLGKQILEIADRYTLNENKLRLVTESAEDLLFVEKELYDQARRSHASYEASIDLYSRFARATESMGTSKEDLIRITETLNKATIISGATQQEAAASMLQLSQGMASGVLRGEEFNSVTENASRISKILADHLGVTIGELRAMSKEGKITSTVMIAAFGGAATKIDNEFARMRTTVSQSITDFKTVFNSIINDANTSSGATYGLADAIVELSEYLDIHRDDFAGYFSDGLIAGKEFSSWMIAFGRDAKPALKGIQDGLSGIYSTMEKYESIGGISGMEWGLVGYVLLRGGPQAAAITAALLEINNQLDTFGMNIGALKGKYDGFAESLANLKGVAVGDLDWRTGEKIGKLSDLIGQLDQYKKKLTEIQNLTGIRKKLNDLAGGADDVAFYKRRISELTEEIRYISGTYQQQQSNVSGLAMAAQGLGSSSAVVGGEKPGALSEKRIEEAEATSAKIIRIKTDERSQLLRISKDDFADQQDLNERLIAGKQALSMAVMTETEKTVEAIRRKYEGYDQLIQQQVEAGNQTEVWAQKTHEALGVRMQEDLDALKDKGVTVADEMKGAFIGWANGMSGTLTDMVWSAELSFGSILESFGKMLTQMVIQYQIIQPLMQGLFGAFSGGGSTGSQIVRYAKGGVFSGIAGYSNEVITSPTAFSHAGLTPFAAGGGIMGEKGPEAVMPLKRGSDGSLGVVSSGSGSVVNVIINNNSSKSQAKATEVKNADGGKDIVVMIEDVVGNSIMSGRGKINRAMRSTFGMSQLVVGR